MRTFVKFKPEYDEGENKYPIELIEARGDRALICVIVEGMTIHPTQLVKTDMLEEVAS